MFVPILVAVGVSVLALAGYRAYTDPLKVGKIVIVPRHKLLGKGSTIQQTRVPTDLSQGPNVVTQIGPNTPTFFPPAHVRIDSVGERFLGNPVIEGTALDSDISNIRVSFFANAIQG